MDSSGIFLLPDGRLRAGWRLLIFVFSYQLASAVLSLLPMPASGGFAALMLRSMLLRTVAAALVSAAMMRLFERRRFREIGLTLSPGWSAALGLGGIAGAVLLLLTAGGAAVAGGVQLEPVAPDAAAAVRQAFLLWTAVLLLGAAAEELLFRGYPFQVLVEGAGAFLATAGAAALFAAFHFRNPGVTEVSTLNTALAGVMLSLAYLRSRSLWYPIGLHFSWNWSMAALGFPLSGLNLPSLGWTARMPEQAAWLHGGAYGPEGGVVCTAVLLLMLAALWRRPAWVGCRVLGGSPATPPAPPSILAASNHPTFS